MSKKRIALVGDGIENPGNALAMMHAAEMYGVNCQFRDTKNLSGSTELADSTSGPLELVTDDELVESNSQLIAFDNLPGARDVYGFRASHESRLIVGNERRGISHRLRSMANDTVHVRMHSKRIDCLNVAAASAVALHYLVQSKSGPMAQRRNTSRHRARPSRPTMPGAITPDAKNRTCSQLQNKREQVRLIYSNAPQREAPANFKQTKRKPITR